MLGAAGEGGSAVQVVRICDLFEMLGAEKQRRSDLAAGEMAGQDNSERGPNADVRRALKALAQKRVPRLMIVDDDGVLKGVLSLSDRPSEKASGGTPPATLEKEKACKFKML